MIQEGKPAPRFDLPAHDGARVKLEELRGKKVVLYFYPRDATPGCTREAQAFRDAKRELDARGAVVLGVSRDSLASHERFAKAEQLPFPLLSDPDASVIRAYGAWGEKTLYGKKSEGILRTTVLIDGAGRVRKIFSKVKVEGHVERVLEALDEIET